MRIVKIKNDIVVETREGTKVVPLDSTEKEHYKAQIGWVLENDILVAPPIEGV